MLISKVLKLNNELAMRKLEENNLTSIRSIKVHDKDAFVYTSSLRTTEGKQIRTLLIFISKKDLFITHFDGGDLRWAWVIEKYKGNENKYRNDMNGVYAAIKDRLNNHYDEKLSLYDAIDAMIIRNSR